MEFTERKNLRGRIRFLTLRFPDLIALIQLLAAFISIFVFLSPVLGVAEALRLTKEGFGTEIKMLIAYNFITFLISSQFIRLYYKEKENRDAHNRMGESLHRFSEAVRHYHCSREGKKSKEELWSLKKLAAQNTITELEKIVTAMIPNDSMTIVYKFFSSKGNIYSAAAVGRQAGAGSPKQPGNIATDTCFLLLKAISEHSSYKKEREFVTLTAIEGKKVPENLEKIWNDIRSLPAGAPKTLGGIAKDPADCWMRIAQRATERKYRSLFRVHINSVTTGNQKIARGLLLITSQDPFAFHTLAQWKIDTIFACADQLYDMLTDYPIPEKHRTYETKYRPQGTPGSPKS